jgi:SAM-dependent methyltransferase
MKSDYSRDFYLDNDRGMSRSARAILSEFLQGQSVRSAIDVGCGRGNWLQMLLELKVEHVLGLDGPWVRNAGLLVPEQNFRSTDLLEPIPDLGHFDVGLCFEVLEHLSDEAGKRIVGWLCGSCEQVLFSAAVPGQGGTGHINEQWQSYWARIFESNGFVADLTMRNKLWLEADIKPWYKQNLIVFRRRGAAAPDPSAAGRHSGPLDLVHPEMFVLKMQEKAALANFDANVINLRAMLAAIPKVVASKIRRKFLNR